MTIEQIQRLINEGLFSPMQMEEIIPKVLRAVCKDEHKELIESFIAEWDNIEWDWWPNG